jgi:hypothetical protein
LICKTTCISFLSGRIDAILDRADFAHRTQPLVCAHLRLGRSEAGMKTDTAVRADISTLPVLWDFVRPWLNNGSKLFMASDSMLVSGVFIQFNSIQFSSIQFNSIFLYCHS